MKAKIVLALEEALQALQQEKFDIAVVLHDATGEWQRPHSTLLVGRLELTRAISSYEFSPKPLEAIGGFSVFRLNDYQTLGLAGSLSLVSNILEEVFPGIEIVGRHKWRYDDSNKIVELHYPYIHWGSTWGRCYRFHMFLSKHLYAYFTSQQEAEEQIEWAVSRNFIDQHEAGQLLAHIQGLVLESALFETKDEAEVARARERKQQCITLATDLAIEFAKASPGLTTRLIINGEESRDV